MRRFALLAAGSLCGAAAFSQSLVDCIDPDVLNGLLLRGEHPVTFSAAVPPELATFKAPTQFTWIGSSERRVRGLNFRAPNASSGSGDTEMVTAAYRSSLPPAAGRIAALGALTAAGWKLAPPRAAAIGPAVFVIDARTRNNERHCLDGDAASVFAATMDGVNYVTVTITRYPPNGASICDPPLSTAGFSLRARIFPLEEQLPNLQAPPDPASGRAVEMRYGGGTLGIGPYYSVVRLTLKDSVGNVARHFAGQMVRQGWTADSTWSGTTTAGSTWSKEPAANQSLHATLSVSTQGDEQFAASIRVFNTK